MIDISWQMHRSNYAMNSGWTDNLILNYWLDFFFSTYPSIIMPHCIVCLQCRLCTLPVIKMLKHTLNRDCVSSGRPRRPNDRGENGEWRKHREISCYNCQQSGHVMHDCPHPQRSGARDGGNRRVNKGGGRDNKKVASAKSKDTN